MNYKNLEDVDLKLLLLSGKPIYVDNLKVSPYTLKEIMGLGYSFYMQNLQWLSITIDDFIESTENPEEKLMLISEKDNLRAFDFYMQLGGANIRNSMLSALSMIFRTDDIRVLHNGVVAIDFFKLGIFYNDDEGKVQINEDKLKDIPEEDLMIVSRDNFDVIVEVVKLQNCLIKPDETEGSKGEPADEATRALMEHMENMRKKVEEKKRKQKAQDNGDNIDISDIVSAVSSKSHSINKLNIWDFTLYQIYDEYARLELIDNYDFSIKAIMAGASDINLKHWSSKM